MFHLLRITCYRQSNLFLINTNLIRMSYKFPFAIYNKRNYSKEEKNAKTIIERKFNSELKEATPFEKVKENTRTFSYLGVILIGVGVTGLIFYQTLRELFSSQSPNNIYSAAFDRCCKDTKLTDKLGEPLKGFGEETRRGRRQHVSHAYFNKDGINYLRMKFYIQGSRRRGIVHLEMKENQNNKYEYNYLIVELEGLYREIMILEDNRNSLAEQIMA